MSFLDYLGLVSLREHNRAMELVRRQRDDETKRANGLSAELAAMTAERDAILRDKKLETARRTEAVSHGIALSREVQSLRPDAQKWRDRKQADRDYRAEKRAQTNV